MFNINLPQNRGWWLSGWEPLFEWHWSESCPERGDSWGGADPCLLYWALGQYHPQKCCPSILQRIGNWQAPVGPLMFSAAGKRHGKVRRVCIQCCCHGWGLTQRQAQQGMSTHPGSQFAILPHSALGFQTSSFSQLEILWLVIFAGFVFLEDCKLS